jgi:hypothetical protein
MSLLFCDSFSTYTDLSTRYSAYNGWFYPGPAAGRFDSMGLVLSPLNNIACVTYNLGNRTTMTMGFAINIPQSSVNGFLCGFQDNGVIQVNINCVGTSLVPAYFQAQRGGSTGNGTNIGSPSANVMTLSAWHYIELQATISPTAGTVILKLDGNVVLNLTGMNTQNTANAWCNQAYVAGNTGINFDDLYVADTLGTVNNSFLGEIKVVGSLPVANGSLMNFTSAAASWTASLAMTFGQTIIDSNSNVQRVSATTGDAKTGATAPAWATALNATTADNHVTWTNLGASGAYKMVNESNHDDDSSYIFDGTPGDQARFTFAAATGAAVKGVQLYGRARKDDVGPRAFRFVCKSGSTIADNGADLTLSTTYQNWITLFENDPNANAAWTPPTLNAAEFGIKTV